MDKDNQTEIKLLLNDKELDALSRFRKGTGTVNEAVLALVTALLREAGL